eukprot:14398447-Alexandrium_andersonii.AAC.1
MVQGFHSIILHIVRKMTEDRRKTRESQMDAVARMGHQLANLMDLSFLQQAVARDFTEYSKE